MTTQVEESKKNQKPDPATKPEGGKGLLDV
jgi:hypothetical protein